MRISFDLDHTLVLPGKMGREGSEGKLFSGEILRKGTIGLLKDLSRDHELWIYTTSYRKQWILKFSFWLKGVKIRKVINERTHQKMIKHYNHSIQPSKYPKHYEIDVHIDDSIGVLKEGSMFGFRVIQVDPEDYSWTETIKREVVKMT